MDKWIRVTDELPEYDTNVLIYAIGTRDDSVIAITSYTNRKFGYNIEGWIEPWQYFFYDYTITHWMPLPSAPKEEQYG